MTAGPTERELLLDVLLTDHGSAGPYEAFRRLRETQPVLVTRSGALVLSRYDDCAAALRNRSLGKADESLGFGLSEIPEELQRQAMHRFRRTMLFRNPPDHHRLRRLVADVFTPRHIDELRGRVVTQIRDLIDVIEDQGSADIISDLALPLPVNVIGDLLGVPVTDRAVAAPLVRALVASLEPSADAAALTAACEAEDQLATYFTDLLAAKRAHPDDDLLSRLAVAHGDDVLDDDECVGTAILLFAAGFETTTNLIGNGVAALLAHPSQMDLLRARPDLASNAVEELLRYDSPVQTNGRTVLEPTRVAGVDLDPGQVVLTLLGAANRDPDRFCDPDSLDITRTGTPPLSFGAGIHFCLGAPLARLEGAVLFPLLTARFPGLRLVEQPRWRTGLSFRGLSSLKVVTGC
ncbi:cytochrome P450 [Nocardia farcinica]|uniref:Cytochrome P450 n=1 Tax=Nocardia cyriacigeorgica TaxID=135487 RepID=A0A2L2JXT4_9NOCA|nr:cytochrome P450 [Nocardia cyriacigeorgica]MBF6072747.1 cytochrome P450 [Nocardia farcinica]MCP2293483.1 Cytochrome P450 [Nocardia amikacinitolerans]PEH77710.1 cytochrome [Nocardia sp. FDAARGOS_372]AVH24659.1 cytochrome P450 [Nocardia cyriacigeorgica]MBF6189243.1 cytochrome P450 [Nocardia farcinica]